MLQWRTAEPVANLGSFLVQAAQKKHEGSLDAQSSQQWLTHRRERRVACWMLSESSTDPKP